MNETIKEQQAQIAMLVAALEAINEWCSTDDGAHALPYEPPWAKQLQQALALEKI